MNESLLLPADYRPAAEGNITWKLETDRARYVELHELDHGSLLTRDTRVGDAASIEELTRPHYVRSLQLFNAVRTYQARTPISLSEEFLKTWLLFYRQP